jgi:molybdate transport system regulatory protein
MSKTDSPLLIRLRVDLGPQRSIGPGKIALLEQIEHSGSLSQAARQLKMSYRRAWLLLDDLNHAFSEAVTTASIGGAGGGGARLTPFGRRVVAGYREVEHAAGEMAAARLNWLAGELGEGVSKPRPLSRPLSAGRPDRPPPEKRARAAKRP